LISICGERGHEAMVCDGLALPYRPQFFVSFERKHPWCSCGVCQLRFDSNCCYGSLGCTKTNRLILFPHPSLPFITTPITFLGFRHLDCSYPPLHLTRPQSSSDRGDSSNCASRRARPHLCLGFGTDGETRF